MRDFDDGKIDLVETATRILFPKTEEPMEHSEIMGCGHHKAHKKDRNFPGSEYCEVCEKIEQMETDERELRAAYKRARQHSCRLQSKLNAVAEKLSEWENEYDNSGPRLNTYDSGKMGELQRCIGDLQAVLGDAGDD